jgi:hypothetical protein
LKAQGSKLHELYKKRAVGTWIFFKMEEYFDRTGFHPLPAPPPMRYSLAEFNGGLFWKISDIG